MKTIELAPRLMKIAYDDVGTGLPIVLLHAFPLDRSMWAPQVDPISSAGFRVIALDLPEFGGTSPNKDGFTIDLCADMVASFLEALDISKAVVVGLSMGGYVAMSIARRHPERLAGMILADTRAAPDVPQARASRDKLIAAVQAKGPVAAIDAMLSNLFSEQTRATNPAVIERARQIILRQSTSGIVAGLRALRDRPDAAPELHSVTAPLLVLVGEFDTVTPLLAAARIAGNVRKSDLAHIPGAGHLSNLENPEAFNSAVIAFLKQLT
ncbi:MAG TPA: alpha/beta hydrolase [Gemmata sp.]|nr:alpha/beta hydrolase [Gemmata sp.]